MVDKRISIHERLQSQNTVSSFPVTSVNDEYLTTELVNATGSPDLHLNISHGIVNLIHNKAVSKYQMYSGNV